MGDHSSSEKDIKNEGHSNSKGNLVLCWQWWCCEKNVQAKAWWMVSFS